MNLSAAVPPSPDTQDGPPRELGLGLWGRLTGRSLSNLSSAPYAVRMRHARLSARLQRLDRRPFFTYWLCAVQTAVLVLVLSLNVADNHPSSSSLLTGMAPFGLGGLAHRTGLVFTEFLTLEQVGSATLATAVVVVIAATSVAVAAVFTSVAVVIVAASVAVGTSVAVVFVAASVAFAVVATAAFSAATTTVPATSTSTVIFAAFTHNVAGISAFFCFCFFFMLLFIASLLFTIQIKISIRHSGRRLRAVQPLARPLCPRPGSRRSRVRPLHAPLLLRPRHRPPLLPLQGTPIRVLREERPVRVRPDRPGALLPRPVRL